MTPRSSSSRLVSGAIAVALVLGGACWQVWRAHAQEASVRPARPVGEYAGVRPGAGHSPPREAAARRLATSGRPPVNVLTWPGFEPRAGGRFFLQTTGTVTTETRATDGRFEVLLRGARTHLRNTRRPLVTRFFNTPVTEARIERRGRHDLAFVFHLRAPSVPSVSESAGENGYRYLYVDFPAGSYVEVAPPVTP